MACAGELIVGMHLDREVAGGIDEFHQQGEFCSVCLENVFAHQYCAKAVDQLAKGAAGQLAVLDDGLAAAHGADFPALADITSVGRQTLDGFQAAAAPDDFMKIVFEKKWIHYRV